MATKSRKSRTRYKKRSWICKVCKVDFKGPRALGIHYEAMPDHAKFAARSSKAWKDNHPNATPEPKPALKEAVEGNGVPRNPQQLVDRAWSIAQSLGMRGVDFSRELGLNSNYMTHHKRQKRKYFLKDTRERLENFILKHDPGFKAAPKIASAGLPTVPESEARIMRATFCTDCGTRFGPATWKYCAKCGAKRATL